MAGAALHGPRRRRCLGAAVPEEEGHLDLPGAERSGHGRGAAARAPALRQRRDLSRATRPPRRWCAPIKKGDGFFNLPDMDFGTRDAAFVPFFGVPAVTLLAPSRLAKALNMVVQPIVAEILPGGQGYRVRLRTPWSDFPADDPVADAARMNRWIESEIQRNPAQYLWVHQPLQDPAAGRVLRCTEPAAVGASIISACGLRFTKMQGAGNDFVVLDATRAPLALDSAQMQRLGRPPLRCRRRPDPGGRAGADAERRFRLPHLQRRQRRRGRALRQRRALLRPLRARQGLERQDHARASRP